MDEPSLYDYLDRRLQRLCDFVGTDPRSASLLLADLLGPAAARPIAQPPLWPSDIADDHTPVEFSVAFNASEPPTLRILGETLAAKPSPAANQAAACRFVQAQAARFGHQTAQFDRVRDVFATDEPLGQFALWHSLVFRHGRAPEFKVYFNPEVQGVARSPALVAAALDRLGLGEAYPTLVEYGVRPGELGGADRLTFFALDLHDGPHARVKLYLSHHGARADDAARAARAVPDVGADDVNKFCEIAGGGVDVFSGRPLVSSYTFLDGVRHPVGYSVYVPIRSYVADDAEAYDRVADLLERYRFDRSGLDRVVAAMADRSLHDGRGLIAHVSLRLGLPRPGVTVYLSAEAYEVLPPRPRWQTIDQDRAQRPSDRCAA